MFLNIPEEWNLHQQVHKPKPLAISSSLNSPSTNKSKHQWLWWQYVPPTCQ